MQEEILSLKLRISQQEEVLKGTIQRLRSTSRTKESMEHFIVNQCECFVHLRTRKRDNFTRKCSHTEAGGLEHIGCVGVSEHT